MDLLKRFKENPHIISLEDRFEYLNQLKSIIKNKEESISLALKLDLAKSVFESYLTEVSAVLSIIDHTLKNLDKWIKPEKVATPLNLLPAQSYIYSEPYGDVLIISPWNYPFQLAFAPLIGAIAAGNRVVLKPSEVATNTSVLIQEICHECFSEDDVICIEGGVEETTKLLEHKFDYIFFTGSSFVGKIIMKAAANHLTPVTLELGGKSPCLVDRDSNLKNAAKKIIWGKILNAGQTCVAPDYVLVFEENLEELLEHMQAYINEFLGKDILNSPDYGRIINLKNFQRLEKLLSGHEQIIGGKKKEDLLFIEPTLVVNPKLDSEIMMEEIFGPILPIISMNSFEEMISFIKRREKPLAAYCFTDDQYNKELFLNQLSFGGGCINDVIVHLANPNLPFGGVGASGIGQYNGKKSFDTFSHFKSVLHQSSKIDFPVRYPPYNDKLKWLKLIR